MAPCTVRLQWHIGASSRCIGNQPRHNKQLLEHSGAETGLDSQATGCYHLGLPGVRPDIKHQPLIHSTEASTCSLDAPHRLHSMLPNACTSAQAPCNIRCLDITAHSRGQLHQLACQMLMGTTSHNPVIGHITENNCSIQTVGNTCVTMYRYCVLVMAPPF